ncbi:GntT/GntP/DsdX family permease [Pseudomonas oryzihabitans]|uniref:GntT/GntP/DsdX family permease n=1 Tax=Pseudomonas oryzihabitans TaxID=47885 RepID=UPI0011A46EFE|nr:gluconate:H+ symporter [Pseudomonas psychrotolerans]
MATSTLLLIGLLSILSLLILIIPLKLPPFIALISVATATALVSGVAPAQLALAVEGGLGKTLGHIAVIIALGAMIGRMIDISGGATALSRRLVMRLGSQRVLLALALAAFAVGVPVFFEVGVIMLIPLAAGLAMERRWPLYRLGLPMCGVMLVVHALLPPHPGAVAVAAAFGVEVGRVLAFGLPIAAATCVLLLVTGRRLFERPYQARALASEPQAPVTGPAEARLPAGPGRVVLVIVCPIVLILLGVLAPGLPLPPALRATLEVLGVPYVALLVDVFLAMGLLGLARGMPLREVSAQLAAAVPGIAMIILITGAGGAFANIMVQTGIGAALASAMQATGLPILLLAYLITLTIRAAQGPTTVALMTTAGIVLPLIPTLGLSPNQTALVGLAMGAGGIGLSHVNDAGFWIVTRLLGLSVADGLRSWTLLTTLASLFALGCIACIWPFV